MPKELPCRICDTPSQTFLKLERTFYKCPACTLIFTDETASKTFAARHYKGQWKNTDEVFWNNQCAEIIAMLERYELKEKSRILDFGAGAGEITRRLQQHGYDVTPLEPLEHGFLKDQSYENQFDFVIGIEVIEHILDLYGELEEIKKVLAPRGMMFFTSILTNNFVDTPQEKEAFTRWWYKDDPTHVSFFSNKSLFELSKRLFYDIDIYGDQAFVLSRDDALLKLENNLDMNR